MTYDNFTIKSQESILQAQRIAASIGQQQVDTPHLIRGILEIEENVAAFLLGKMDVNLATLGEWGFGAGQGMQNIVCMFIGTGIGSGLIVDGRLHQGHNQAAGEVG